MDIEEKLLVRLELMKAIRDEHAIGTQIDVAFAFKGASHKCADLLVHERLPTANRHNWSTALVDGRHALLNGKPFSD